MFDLYLTHNMVTYIGTPFFSKWKLGRLGILGRMLTDV